jgi:hypothetical protein
MLLHQHSGDGAAHSSGKEQLAQRFFIGPDEEEPITTDVDAGADNGTREEVRGIAG